jgi:hypothetical protein
MAGFWSRLLAAPMSGWVGDKPVTLGHASALLMFCQINVIQS